MVTEGAPQPLDKEPFLFESLNIEEDKKASINSYHPPNVHDPYGIKISQASSASLVPGEEELANPDPLGLGINHHGAK